jgi:hypothetical protein
MRVIYLLKGGGELGGCLHGLVRDGDIAELDGVGVDLARGG